MFDPIEKILGRKLVKRDWFSRNAMAPAMGGGGSSGSSGPSTTVSHVDVQGHPYTISYSAPVHATPQPVYHYTSDISKIPQTSITIPATSMPIRSDVPMPARSGTAAALTPMVTRAVSAPAPSISTPFVPQMYKVSPGAFTSRDITKPYYGQVVTQTPSGRMGIDQGIAVNLGSAADRSAYREATAFRTYPSPTAMPKVMEAFAFRVPTVQPIKPIEMIVPNSGIKPGTSFYDFLPGTSIPMSKGVAGKISEFTGQPNLTPLQSRGMVLVSKGEATIQPNAPLTIPTRGVMGDMLSVAGLKGLPIRTEIINTGVVNNPNIIRAQLGALGQQLVNEGLLSPSGQILSNRTGYR